MYGYECLKGENSGNVIDEMSSGIEKPFPGLNYGAMSRRVTREESGSHSYSMFENECPTEIDLNTSLSQGGPLDQSDWIQKVLAKEHHPVHVHAMLQRRKRDTRTRMTDFERISSMQVGREVLHQAVLNTSLHLLRASYL
ncbi:unnamed protein product [Darwinula stevensoni]|uniref:Uncharacterized protein n=1 Tax=Darwinula stevensoni TaxID=69355 RepID=A0A7R9A7T3_9CRUS|nr:unnamed protein product [Darwinula stevensoni]CAG0894904.1 unnamed protein product [Darwinula stevensoni]